MHDARGIQRLIYCFANLLRPWHENGLAEALQFGEVEAEGFIRGFLLRAARLSVQFDLPDEVFELLGPEHLQRTLRAWRPRHLLLLEDVSMAIHPIMTRATEGQPVQQIHIDRAVEILRRYHTYWREVRSPDEIRAAILRYIAQVGSVI